MRHGRYPWLASQGMDSHAETGTTESGDKFVNESIANRLRHCKTLPTLPAVAIRVIDLANEPDVNLDQLSGLVGLDPALSAKLVKTANSALYQSHRSSTNVRQAIELLGTHAAMMIVLSFSLAASFKN